MMRMAFKKERQQCRSFSISGRNFMNWKHSRYQILHTIIANCHTYDEAYRVLRELEQDRNMAVELSFVESRRAQAKVLNAKTILAQKDEHAQDFDMIRADADVMETKARTDIAQSCLDEARRELAFIRHLIELVNPHRTFKHLEDWEAHQLCQPLEWKLDLLWKSYSMICATGNISYDHFINIKMHPHSEKLTKVVNNLLLTVREGKHSELFNIGKAELFAQVCDKQTEKFIETPIQTTLELTYELPNSTDGRTGLEFKNSGTDE